MQATIADRELLMYMPTESETGSPVITLYKRILAITTNMREAASVGKWEDLLSLGKLYHEAAESLRLHPEQAPLSAEEHDARVRLLSEILENDARMRDYASPELARISVMLNQINQQKSMLMAYGKISGETMP